VLDLGAWNSLQTAANFITTTDRFSWIKQMCESMKQAWDKWRSAANIGSLFSYLRIVAKCIEECKGGNNFVLPHRNSGSIKYYQIIGIPTTDQDFEEIFGESGGPEVTVGERH